MSALWLPDRPSEPVIDNWPPKPLLDLDYEPSGLTYRFGGVAVPTRAADSPWTTADGLRPAKVVLAAIAPTEEPT